MIELEESVKDSSDPATAVSDAELAKDPRLGKLAQACESGVPGGCDELKTDLKKTRAAAAAKQAAKKVAAKKVPAISAKPAIAAAPKGATVDNTASEEKQKAAVKKLAKKQAVTIAAKIEAQADTAKAELKAKKTMIKQQA